MIKHCPICGSDSGVTHGDQLWVDAICDACIDANEEIIEEPIEEKEKQACTHMTVEE